MSATILCNGCGQQVRIPDDHTRPKMRCPAGGVVNDVPASALGKGAEKSPTAPADPRTTGPDSPTPGRASAPTVTKRRVLACPECGERVRLAPGQPATCPVCGSELAALPKPASRPAGIARK